MERDGAADLRESASPYRAVWSPYRPVRDPELGTERYVPGVKVLVRALRRGRRTCDRTSVHSSGMGIVRTATEAKIAALSNPDVALTALALRLAEILDGEDANAAAALQYRLTVNALVAAATPSMTLDDLVEDDEPWEPGEWPKAPGPWGGRR